MDANRVLQLAWTQTWQIAAVALIVGAAVRLFCRQRPHLAYALWLVVLLKCFVPPLLHSPTSVFSWAGARHQLAATVPQMPTYPEAERMPQAATNPTADRNAIIARIAQSQLGARDNLSPPMIAKNARKPSDEGKVIAPIVPPAVKQLPFSEMVLGLWLAGTAVSAAWLVVQVIRLRRRLRASGEASPQLDSLLAELRQALGVRRAVRLVITTEPLGPALVGLFRPRIVVPAAIANEKVADDLHPILAHELIHLRRGDSWIALAQCAARCVWWFHPAVWFANRRLCCERELCCDEEVIAGLHCEPASYAAMLLDVLRSRRRRIPAFVTGISALEVTTRRLKHIMRDSARFQRRAPKSSWLALAISCAIVLPGAGILLRSDIGFAQWPHAFPPIPHPAPTSAVNNSSPLPPDVARFFCGDDRQRHNLAESQPVLARGGPGVGPPAMPSFGDQPKRTGFWFDWTWREGLGTCQLIGGENGRYRIKSTVLDHATGKPIAGATVRVVCSTKLAPHDLQAVLDQSPKAGGPAGLDVSYTTDEHGTFEFLLTPDAPHAPMPNIGAVISCPGYAPRTFPVRNLWDIARSRAIGEQTFFPRAKLFPAEEIHGTLVDPQGKPLGGVGLSSNFYDDGGLNNTLSAATDANGHFKLSVPKGATAATLDATPPDSDWIDIQLELGERRGDLGTLRFEHGHRVTLETVDFYGRPKPGASVWMMPFDDKYSENSDPLATDRNGRCTTRALAPGDYGFEAYDGDGSVRAAFEPVVVHVAEDREPKLVRIREMAHVTLPLRIVDCAGKPIDCMVMWRTDQHGIELFQMGFVSSRTPGKVEMNIPLRWRDIGLAFDSPDRSTSGFIPETANLVFLKVLPPDGEDYVFTLRHGDHGEDLIPTGGSLEFDTQKTAKDLVAVGRRTSPLIITARDPSGKSIDGVAAKIDYIAFPQPRVLTNSATERSMADGFSQPRGLPGRLVNSWIIPGLPFMLTVSAPGFESKSERLTLIEGEAKRVDFTLARRK